MQLDYQPGEDRLVLTLAGEASVQHFWLTRRQCITLVVACRSAQGEAPALKVATQAAMSPQQSRTEQSSGAGPQLARLTLRKLPHGLRLTISPEGGPALNLLLKSVDQLGLLRTLLHLANRAHWDLDAAEYRAAANAVMNKARRLH